MINAINKTISQFYPMWAKATPQTIDYHKDITPQYTLIQETLRKEMTELTERIKELELEKPTEQIKIKRNADDCSLCKIQLEKIQTVLNEINPDSSFKGTPAEFFEKLGCEYTFTGHFGLNSFKERAPRSDNLELEFGLALDCVELESKIKSLKSKEPLADFFKSYLSFPKTPLQQNIYFYEQILRQKEELLKISANPTQTFVCQL